MQEVLSQSYLCYYCFGLVCDFLASLLAFLLGVPLFLRRSKSIVTVGFVGWSIMIHNREFEKNACNLLPDTTEQSLSANEKMLS